MINLIRTNSQHPDFINLVQLLDAYLQISDGDEHSFYDQFNKLDAIKYVVVAYHDDTPVGCGAIKQYDSATMEVKRMFVSADVRGKGIATQILWELEKWTQELNFQTCMLETGINQLEAVALYKKNGYAVIPNYGQYAGKELSVCFEKKL